MIARPDKLRIVHYPDPILKRVARTVSEFGDDLRRLGERMLQLMEEAEGVGLAAPQVGVGIRMFVSAPAREGGSSRVVVNPRFVELSGADQAEEGCLSLPRVFVSMRRATRAVMQAVDTDGNPVELIGTGMEARVWQHELDHLDGRLIIDNMSPSDEIANRRLLRELREQYPPLRSK